MQIGIAGAGFSGASAIHMNVFGLNPVVVFGSARQQQAALPPLIAGAEKACFAVTEPDAGLDTTHLKTQAVLSADGTHYRVDGRKIWISTAQVADRMLLLARTTPLDQVAKPTQGLSLFYTALGLMNLSLQPALETEDVEALDDVTLPNASPAQTPANDPQGQRVHKAGMTRRQLQEF